jgi:hypothetical protein
MVYIIKSLHYRYYYTNAVKLPTQKPALAAVMCGDNNRDPREHPRLLQGLTSCYASYYIMNITLVYDIYLVIYDSG